MVFSDTSAKNGLLQDCEFWTGLGDAAITGDATLIKVITSRINQAFDRIEPFFLQYLKTLGFDDTNNAGLPTKSANIVSGTNTYQALADSNSLPILVITDVAIVPSSGSTTYAVLQQISADDPEAPLFISPNASSTGVPSRVLILGNNIYFDVIPNYNATNGIKYFFSREHYRFVSTDTTKEPGLPVPFHSLLSAYASRDWLAVNKPANTSLLTILGAEIREREAFLDDFIGARTPTKATFTTSTSQRGSTSGRIDGMSASDSNR